MLPFLVLLGLVVLGFTFSMHLLMQHAPQGGGYFDDELLSLYNVVNMGFRFVPPNSTLMRSYWQASVRKYVGAGGGQRRAAMSRVSRDADCPGVLPNMAGDSPLRDLHDARADRHAQPAHRLHGAAARPAARQRAVDGAL